MSYSCDSIHFWSSVGEEEQNSCDQQVLENLKSLFLWRPSAGQHKEELDRCCSRTRWPGEAPCRGQAQHLAAGKVGNVTPAGPSHSMALGGRGGKGNQTGAALGCVQPLPEQGLGSLGSAHTEKRYSELTKETQHDAWVVSTAGRLEVRLLLAKHSWKLGFINWLCTLSKLTLEAYGKYCPTCLCLPQGKWEITESLGLITFFKTQHCSMFLTQCSIQFSAEIVSISHYRMSCNSTQC